LFHQRESKSMAGRSGNDAREFGGIISRSGSEWGGKIFISEKPLAPNPPHRSGLESQGIGLPDFGGNSGAIARANSAPTRNRIIG
jgi:hypothetical protein